MRIGISLLTHAGHNIWNNGIGQNVYHLARLIAGLGFVERVVLLDCGDQACPPAEAGLSGSHFPIVPLREAEDVVDIAIEMSGALHPEWIARFRARGGKLAFHNCGQPYAALVEPTIFGHAGYLGQADRCDEVWLLPKDRAFTAMMRSIHRCPVHEVPYLWSPEFLRASSEEGEGQGFGYRPGSLAHGTVAPAIFEPNISPGKMGVIPLLICEEAERRSPGRIARVDLFNAAHMRERPTFAYLLDATDLHGAGKVVTHGRDFFARAMARGANMVVSHQINWSQNYLYLDALAGGYPLLHNSPLFAEAGYYYPLSDVEAGADQFDLACREHDHNQDSYRASAERVMASLSPDHRGNRDAYARRLLAIRGERRAA